LSTIPFHLFLSWMQILQSFNFISVCNFPIYVLVCLVVSWMLISTHTLSWPSILWMCPSQLSLCALIKLIMVWFLYYMLGDWKIRVWCPAEKGFSFSPNHPDESRIRTNLILSE
jgi:hypothetical protein